VFGARTVADSNVCSFTLSTFWEVIILKRHPRPQLTMFITYMGNLFKACSARNGSSPGNIYILYIKMYCTVRYWHVSGNSFVQSTGLYWRVIGLCIQLNVLQTVREYPASCVRSCKPRCLQRCSTATLTRGHWTSSPRVVGYREVVRATRQCSIVRQRISVSTPNSCIVACAMFSWH